MTEAAWAAASAAAAAVMAASNASTPSSPPQTPPLLLLALPLPLLWPEAGKKPGEAGEAAVLWGVAGREVRNSEASGSLLS